MDAFHDVRFPLGVSFGAMGGPERQNEIVRLTSGREKRNARVSRSRRHYDAGTGVRSLEDLYEVLAFFEARRGSLHSFRFRDPFDMKSRAPHEVATALDQVIGMGDGERDRFALVKTYGEGADAYRRPIRRPVAASVLVAVAGVAKVASVDFWIDHATGEVVFAGGVSVEALIAAILKDHGLPLADTSRADGMVAGYVVSNSTTARAAIEPLTTLFGIGVRDGEDGLVFATEGRGNALVLDELVVDETREIVERVREPDHALPALAHLDFRDPLNDHQTATAAADYVGAKGSGTSYISFPGVLSAAEAEGLVRDLLRRSWDGRERVAFSVPLAAQLLRPGSVVRLPGTEGPDYLVTEVEDGLARFVKARRVVRVAAAPAAAVETPGRSGANESFAAGRPHAVFLDLPLRSARDAPQDQLRLAVQQKPWRSQAVLVSPEETGFALRTVAERRAVMGELVEALPYGGLEGRIDRAAAVVVRLYDGELESVSRAQLLNGANAAAVRSFIGEWEILQFAAAEEIAPSLWRLTGLLRGQLGTNDAMAAGAGEGAEFVLLDEAVTPVGLRAEEIGIALNWRVGPAGLDLSDENFLQAGITGGRRALLPLSPVHLRGRMEGGDLHLT